MVHAFHVKRSQNHLKWDNSLQPVLSIDSGEEVTWDLLDGGNNQITATSTTASLSDFDFSISDPANGPIYIRGALPGDVLKIEFLSLETADFGWTAIFPGFGLLSDIYTVPELKIWDLAKGKESGFAVFKKGIHIPIRPFLGIVGVAHEARGQFDTIPPYDTGGNIDCKHITVGSTLYLPVKVPGALFSCGDGHAAQGDGEVCGTAIETPMKARMRFTVEKGMVYVTSPHYLTPSVPFGPKVESKGEYAALGIDAEMREATRKAVKGLVAWLEVEKGLSSVEAYMVASVAGDLKIAEAVDMPHYAVACSLPLSIFVNE